jgi:hypothetical protein
MSKIPQQIAELYIQPVLVSQRITRMEETGIGRYWLDAKTAWNLGTEAIGLFVQNIRGVDAMHYQISRIVDSDSTWVIVPSSREFLAQTYMTFARDGLVPQCRRSPESWNVGNLLFSGVEGLCRLSQIHSLWRLAGVILLDPLCHVYRARDYRLSNGRNHDRVERVVQFRAENAVGDWQPPLLLMTCQPAKSVPTEQAARAYCLNGWHFVDGRSLKFAPAPVLAHAV